MCHGRNTGARHQMRRFIPSESDVTPIRLIIVLYIHVLYGRVQYGVRNSGKRRARLIPVTKKQ